MNKQAAVDRAFFKGFAERIMKAVDEDEVSSLKNISPWSTSPGKQDRPPRSSYARQDVTRGLVDVIGKTST